MARVEWAVLARHALQDENGCACIIGIFDTGSPAALPARIPLAVCFRLAGAPFEQPEYELTIRTPTGETQSLVKQTLTISERGVLEQNVTIEGLWLQEMGTYTFEVRTSKSSGYARLTLTPPPKVS